MLRDMMPQFDLYQPDTLEAALDLAERLGENGWLVGGGQDSFDWLKNRTKSTPAVIDLSGIATLKGVSSGPDVTKRFGVDGVLIGALTTLTEVETHPLLREQYGLLCQAAGRVASPQIRNAGTLGGNVSQDTRCWYYRGGVDCYRAGGNTCYADTPQGQNREHAIFNASRCVAVTPSDTANALVALGASMVIARGGSERQVPAAKFFIGPDVDIRRMTVIKPGEILTGIHIPVTWAGSQFHFEKVADRTVWDFALLSIAAAFRMNGEVIGDARLVLGGAACVPYRLEAVEQAIAGGKRDAATADRVATLASADAKTLNFNQFKVPLMENLIRRAVRGG
jgi:xanthine dehydrogenase YagS FAD-binding subunit